MKLVFFFKCTFYYNNDSVLLRRPQRRGDWEAFTKRGRRSVWVILPPGPHIHTHTHRVQQTLVSYFLLYMFSSSYDSYNHNRNNNQIIKILKLHFLTVHMTLET